MRLHKILLDTDKVNSTSEEFINTSSCGVTIQATVEHHTSGHVESEITILASNDGLDYFELSGMEIMGAEKASDGFCSNPSWPYYVAKVKSLAPSNTVRVTIGLLG